MPRRVFYRIVDRPDGSFEALVRIEPDGIHRRDGFASLAQAQEWVDGLKALMTALGAPVAREDGAERGRGGASADVAAGGRGERR